MESAEVKIKVAENQSFLKIESMEKPRYVLEFLGMAGAVAMPLWNIPLIVRIIKRKSSADISLAWVWGIWTCIALMFPSSLFSADPVLRAFGTSNLVMFSFVLFVVLKYRRPPAA